MALKNSLVLLLFFTSAVQAKIILPELLAKQAIDNLRFISQDGKFTYYQKRSGSLLVSSNYKSSEVLKGEVGTQYTLFATNTKKKIVVLQNLNFQNFYSLRAKEKIYLMNYGESTASEIGAGIAPSLLFNDTWLSYYNAYTKILTFENTTNSGLKFSIRLNNRINPYFIPQVVMTDDNTVYYTDLSENGAFGILEYKRNTSKSNIIYKSNTPMLKIELCSSGDNLIVGTFGIHGSKEGSSISQSNLPLKDFTKRENIYKSDQNDIGHMVCNYENNKIAFIKNFGKKNEYSFDVAELDISTKNIKQLSELKTVSNIINMDGTLLTQEKGKFLIVKGESDYKNIDTLKTKTEEKSKPSGEAATSDE